MGERNERMNERHSHRSLFFLQQMCFQISERSENLRLGINLEGGKTNVLKCDHKGSVLEKTTYRETSGANRVKTRGEKSDNNISKRHKQKVKLCFIHLTCFWAIIRRFFFVAKFTFFVAFTLTARSCCRCRCCCCLLRLTTFPWCSKLSYFRVFVFYHWEHFIIWQDEKKNMFQQKGIEMARTFFFRSQFKWYLRSS